MEKKNVLDLSDQELLQIGKDNQELSRQVRSIFKQGIEGMRYDMEQIQRILAELTAREALLMTIAGLFAFLPAYLGFKEIYFSYFLIWTFPFLLIAILFFFIASKRANITRAGSQLIPEGLPEELVHLKTYFVALNEVGRIQYAFYQQTLRYFRYGSTCVYIYILSFVLNHYHFTFLGEPNNLFAATVFIFCWESGVYLIWLRETGSHSRGFGVPLVELHPRHQKL